MNLWIEDRSNNILYSSKQTIAPLMFTFYYIYIYSIWNYINNLKAVAMLKSRPHSASVWFSFSSRSISIFAKFHSSLFLLLLLLWPINELLFAFILLFSVFTFNHRSTQTKGFWLSAIGVLVEVTLGVDVSCFVWIVNIQLSTLL